MSTASQLLAELAYLGIRLEAAGDRLRFHPRSAVASGLVERLKVHKAELLALLALRKRLLRNPNQCDRCGSTQYQDFPIHNGRSVRRDCAKCGRFVSFPVWYSNATKDAK